MYQPAHFREDRLDVQHALITAHPLGLLVTASDGVPTANAIPFALHTEIGERGTLRAHLARANAQWRDLSTSSPCLVVFQGAQSYITPSWYASKREHGKVVPTWNYAIVQVRGTPRAVEDAAWLRAHLESLTQSQEAQREHAWDVGDAPDDFIAAQMRGIVGIEIPIEQIEGKWKVSQNRSESDRRGVYDGLRAQEGGDAMGAFVARYGRIENA